MTDATTVNMQAGLELGDRAVTLAATNLADRCYNTGSVGALVYPVARRELMLRFRRF